MSDNDALLAESRRIYEIVTALRAPWDGAVHIHAAVAPNSENRYTPGVGQWLAEAGYLPKDDSYSVRHSHALGNSPLEAVRALRALLEKKLKVERDRLNDCARQGEVAR